MELISREEVNRLLHNQREMQSRVNQLPTYDACYLGSPCEYQNEDVKMPPQMVWVPVTERLPEESGNYLVTTLNLERDKKIVIERLFLGGKWLIRDKDILAWMLLPKPYKEGAEE